MKCSRQVFLNFIFYLFSRHDISRNLLLSIHSSSHFELAIVIRGTHF
uniref:Uncharacterized protein n=1 Tax=Arundo donax TaxID=35708 RepID=A0A0A9C4I1_ARUDO